MTLLQNTLLALLYFITGKISFALFQQDAIVTITIFIPEGIALAAVLLYGYRIVPGIFFGQLLLALTSGLPPFPALGIAAVNAFEAAIAYALFNRFKLDKTLSHFHDLIGLLLLIALILQPLSALLGNTILLISHTIQTNHFFKDAFYWWFGNTVGQFVITPMLLILFATTSNKASELLKYALILIAFTLFNALLQITLNIHNTSLLLIATLPLTLYLSTRNLSYATLATFSLVISSLYFFHLGVGTFVTNTHPVDQLLNLNFFILSHTLLVLIIGVLFHEKEVAIATLKTMAHYDPLTGLPNRHMLDKKIQHAIYLYQRDHQQSVICFIDLDGFKAVNDTYGHDIGDKLLKEVANRVKHHIRLTDTLLRLGGDEFLLILNKVDRTTTEQLLERVMHAVRSIDEIDGHQINISLSIGVASCPADGMTVETLVHAADETMYKIKKSGKNGILYTPNCCKLIEPETAPLSPSKATT